MNNSQAQRWIKDFAKEGADIQGKEVMEYNRLLYRIGAHGRACKPKVIPVRPHTAPLASVRGVSKGVTKEYNYIAILKKTREYFFL